jgi:hypothetical protein
LTTSRYDYFCPANGETVEVQHSWSFRAKTWGDVCRAAGRELGNTPADAPVQRLVSMTRVFRTQQFEEEYPEPPVRQTQHAPDCPCCDLPNTPGVQAFTDRLRRSIGRSTFPENDA